ncbi:hypothetical protein, partial [Pseudopedobacter sp.]|uniref:hypothetical protein n=1 Tax=Pseudopedobacter sp. TaxID=1936787 RepID=UPI00333E5C92
NGILVEYNPEFKAFYSKKILNQSIFDILVSKTGSVYLTASNQGLMVYDQKVSKLQYKNKGATFYSIYEDRSGNVWLEPELDGATLYKPSNNTFYSFKHNKDDKLPYTVKARRKSDKSFNVF